VVIVGYVHTENNTEREQDLWHTSQQMAEPIDVLQSQLNMTAVNFTQNVRDLLADISSLQSVTQYDKLSSDIHQLSGAVEGHSTNIKDLISDTNRLFTTAHQHISRIDTLSATKTSVTTFNSRIYYLSSRINTLSTSITSVTTFNSRINDLSTQINGLSLSVTTFINSSRVSSSLEDAKRKLSADLSRHTSTPHSCSCN